ncbi:hypothetical protein BMS3Bbin04_00727 [bacterium BMS3Bbin04]|nr:hypothetical protein BMS3Bbin04_00727 [bacterium BMS3Bbin04]
MSEVAVGTRVGRENSPIVIASHQNRCPSTVTKKDAGLTVLIVGHAGQNFRTNYQYPVRTSRSNQAVRQLQPVHPAATSRRNVKCGRVISLQFGLDNIGSCRKLHIACNSSDYDVVELMSAYPRIFQSLFAGDETQVRCHSSIFHNPTFFDAGACSDPLIGRVNHLCQVGICQNA